MCCLFTQLADDADNYLPINDDVESPQPLPAVPNPIRETELEINVTSDDYDGKRALTPNTDMDTRI